MQQHLGIGAATRRAVAVTLLVVSVLTVVGTAPPSAAAPALYLPYTGGTQHVVTQGNNSGFSHNSIYGRYAIDFAMPANTNVVASAAGTVVSVVGGCAGLVRNDTCNSGLGNYLVIQHEAGFCTQYAHLNNFVRTSGSVARGEVIARSGNSGWSTGAHLDFRRTACNSVSQPFKFVEYSGSYEDGAIAGRSLTSQNTNSTAPVWAATFVDQSAFLDAGLTQNWNLSNSYRGQEGWLRFRVRNTGTRTWTSGGANPVRLGTSDPRGRTSTMVVVGSWLSPNRAAAVSPASVPPGAIASFTFKVKVPSGTGTWREKFEVVAEGARWFGPVMWRDFARNAPPVVVQPNPFGGFEAVTAPAVGQVRVQGWAIDYSAPTTALQISVVVGGRLGTAGSESTTVLANRRRDDIALRYPGTGSSHGFDATVGTSKSGETEVCAYAVNVGVGQSTLLGCRPVSIPK